MEADWKERSVGGGGAEGSGGGKLEAIWKEGGGSLVNSVSFSDSGSGSGSVSGLGSGSGSSGSLSELEPLEREVGGGGGCERREPLDRWFSFYNIATKL